MIRTVTDRDECRRLWHAVSPHRRAWDEWDLMNAFHDDETYRFRFLVRDDDGRIGGLIPLVHDTSDGSHELFGGCYPDARELWVSPQRFDEWFEALPDNTVFFDLAGAQVDEILGHHPRLEPNFAERDQRFFLQPERFDFDFYNHIATFSSEKRKGFLYDLRKVKERNLELRWSDDEECDLFIALCNRNFGEDSDYAMESGQAELRRVLRALREKGWLRTLLISVDGEKQAVSMSAHYQDHLIALYSASNNDIKNLGKLCNVETIQEGCRLRVAEINYMTGMGWKSAWKMESETCRTMRKPARPAPAEAVAGNA